MGKPGSGGPKFSKTEHEAKLVLAAKMDRMGYNQFDIAEKLGVSQPQVCMYLKKIRQRYREDASVEVKEKIAEVVSGYRDVRKEAEEAWQKSKRPREKKVNEEYTRGGDGSTSTKFTHSSEGQVGDPAFLNVILKTFDMELDVLGITSKANKQETNVSVDVGVGVSWESLNVALAGPVPDRVELEIAQLASGSVSTEGLPSDETRGIANTADGADGGGVTDGGAIE